MTTQNIPDHLYLQLVMAPAPANPPRWRRVVASLGLALVCIAPALAQTQQTRYFNTDGIWTVPRTVTHVTVVANGAGGGGGGGQTGSSAAYGGAVVEMAPR